MNDKVRKALIDSLTYLEQAGLPEMEGLSKSCRDILAGLQNGRVDPSDAYVVWAINTGLQLSLLASSGLPILKQNGLSDEYAMILFNVFVTTLLLDAWRRTAGKMATAVGLADSDMDFLASAASKLSGPLN